jgi:NAD(P)-dependent dehydrogenase (short-subunit alcohol dehydrogenase family)
MIVGVNDICPERADAVVADLIDGGLRAFPVSGDVARGSDVRNIFDRVDQIGPLWLLVNNAGVFHAAATEDLTEDAWDEEFAVDAKAVFLCSQASIRRMIPRRCGRIVNIASIAGLIVRTRQIAYCAAKAAAIHFTRCLAVEMAPMGITVNCICPGMTNTEMLAKSAREQGFSIQAYEAQIPAGRTATPEDHARLITYLATDEAAHVTGQIISVDGAQSLYHPLTASTLRSVEPEPAA